MPKKSRYPKLRVYVKRGREGQVWTSYAYDMRGTGIWLRDMRKYAGQLAPDLAAASKLLQHGSLSTTSQSYRQGDKIRPVR